MGLAYEALTSAYTGSDPTKDSSSNAAHYSPLFKSMVSQGLSAPTFTLALERSNSSSYIAPGGYISFGGYPPIDFDKTFTSTPIEMVSVTNQSHLRS